MVAVVKRDSPQFLLFVAARHSPDPADGNGLLEFDRIVGLRGDVLDGVKG